MYLPTVQPSHQPESVVPLDRRHGNSRRLTQAYDLRDALAKQMLALSNAKLPANTQDMCKQALAVTALYRAWEDVCDRIRKRPEPSKPTPQPTSPKPTVTVAPVQVQPIVEPE